MKQQEKDTVYYLEKAPVPKAIAHMSIPMVMGMVVNMIYNIADAYFIGRLNHTAMLAAITLALPFTAILMAVGQIFGIGGSTYIARLLGEKEEGNARKASSVNFYLALLSGLVFMLICLPFLSPVLQVLGAKGETLQYTKDFVLVYAVGSPFVIANFTLAETVRAEGASTESMIGMVISVVINIILDPVFIFTLKMNVMGAAFATVIGNVCAALYYVWYLKEKSKVQSVSRKDFKPTGEMLSNIFKVGISAFLLNIFLVVSSLMFNNYAMIYGDNVVAAFGVANRVVQICDFIGMGLYTGVVPLIAFTYSAAKQERLSQVLKTTALYLVGITLVVAIMLFLFRQQVIGIFSTDDAVIHAGVETLTALLVSTLFAGFSGLFTSMFQAFGKGVQSNIMSVARGVALIPIIILGNISFGLNGVIWSLPVSEFCACIVGLLLWMSSKKKIMGAAPEDRGESGLENF